MKKLSDIKDIKKLDNKLMARFNKAIKDEEFKNFIDGLGVSYEELCKYTSILDDSLIEYSHCKNCKSILECKNKITGYAYLPKVKNKKIEFQYQMCKYKEEINKKNKYLKNIYFFNIPSEIKSASIKDIDKSDMKRLDTIKYIAEFMKNYDKNQHQKGLYLHGTFGCGKTYIITAMLNELAKRDVKSAIIFWPEYLRMLKTLFNDNNAFKLKYNMVKEVPILLIDDIGAENVTEWGRDEILCSILQYRMDNALPTFFTSNLNLDELTKHLSVTKDSVSNVKAERIIQRIKQLTYDKEILGKNLRK